MVEAPKISETVHLSCTKILEENDEDSNPNLTPRLSEDIEKEITLKEETNNKFYQNTDADGKDNSTIYASKTTLETEETSFCKMEDDDSLNYEKEKPLCLSMISTGGLSNEDKFISPTFTSGRASIPSLNLDKVRRIVALNAVNTSELNTTNYSSNGSKAGVKPPSSLETSMTSSGFGHGKTKYFSATKSSIAKKVGHSKLTIGKKHTKHQSKPSKKLELSGGKSRKCSNEGQNTPWKEQKAKGAKTSFKGNHWDFNKKASPTTQK